MKSAGHISDAIEIQLLTVLTFVINVWPYLQCSNFHRSLLSGQTTDEDKFAVGSVRESQHSRQELTSHRRCLCSFLKKKNPQRKRTEDDLVFFGLCNFGLLFSDLQQKNDPLCREQAAHSSKLQGHTLVSTRFNDASIKCEPLNISTVQWILQAEMNKTDSRGEEMLWNVPSLS